MDLKIDITNTGITKEAIGEHTTEVNQILDRLWSEKEELTGWVKLPMQVDLDELECILNAATVIQGQCAELIVLGVGGSYLGARGAIEALVGFDELYGTGAPSTIYPRVRFAGNNLSATQLSEFLEDVRRKEVCLCVVSKSGTTAETGIAFEILKAEMAKKYGKEKIAERIYVITDKEEGFLRQEAEQEGYKSFEIPKNVGGRYSVLTAVGLLPMAVSGIDIKAMLAGAEAVATSPEWDLHGADYAVARHLLLKSGKQIEVFEYYEPQLEYFAKWLKQLFGESEGKGEDGLYPSTLQMSTELHSMGQFLQEGNQIFFETVLNVIKPCRDIEVPIGNSIFSGRSMNEVNRAAMEGVMAAHIKKGIPVVKIDIPRIDAFYFGQMVYFFENICAISCGLREINAFDQPGIERYKAEMLGRLEK